MEVWVDLGTALDAAATSSDVDEAQIDAARAALEPLLSEPIAASLSATPETVTLETSAAGGAGIAGNTELLAQMPADSWFAVAIEGAGEALRQSLDGIGALGAEMGDPTLDPEAIVGMVESETGLDLEDDLLSWLGNAAFFVSGTSESEFRAGAAARDIRPGGDRRGWSTRCARSSRTPRGQRPDRPASRAPPTGFSAKGPTGTGVELALREDLLVGALGGPDPATELLESGDALADAPLFSAAEDALGGDFAAVFFVAMQDFLVVAEKGDDGDTDYDAARPYTEALEYVILGTAQDDERERARIVVGVGE